MSDEEQNNPLEGLSEDVREALKPQQILGERKLKRGRRPGEPATGDSPFIGASIPVDDYQVMDRIMGAAGASKSETLRVFIEYTATLIREGVITEDGLVSVLKSRKTKK